jgi:hypothetical protein
MCWLVFKKTVTLYFLLIRHTRLAASVPVHDFHVRKFQRRIVVRVNLSDRKIIRRAPLGIHLLQQVWRESICFHCSIIHEKAGFFGGNEQWGEHPMRFKLEK